MAIPNNTKQNQNQVVQAQPPADMDAEKALLGSILLNSQILQDVGDKLKGEYFYDPRHSIVYLAMVELWSTSRPVDVISVLEYLHNTESLNKVSSGTVDKEFLLELISKTSLSTSHIHTSDLIKNKFVLRTIIQVGDEIKNLAYLQKDHPFEILDDAQKQLFDISKNNMEKEFVSITEVLKDTFERISQLHDNDVEFRGVPTGFIDLDNILGGLHSSDLLIIAARPSMGKTSLALELIKHVAVVQKVGVAFFSLEMSKDQLVDKLVSSTSGVSLGKIRSGHLSDDPANNEFIRLGQAIGQLDQAPIWIDDNGALNILELRTKARRLKSKYNVGLIVIDYLQLMSGKNTNYSGNRVQEVSDISRGLKMLAKELQIPIIALSQLSRSVDSREDKRPMLSDLRESGSIEQDADIVMFIHREEMYHKETKKKGIGDLLISKHRNGETGAIELAWIPALATFGNLHGARTSRRVNE
ncbi:MAG: replicative DNA helicase [candidate division SR1 bacterium]|nr:replicative DNA helicase [candidate division SR1 bacterium]